MKELKVLRYLFLSVGIYFGVQFLCSFSGWCLAGAIICGVFFAVSFSKDVLIEIGKQDRKQRKRTTTTTITIYTKNPPPPPFPQFQQTSVPRPNHPIQVIYKPTKTRLK